MPETTESWTPTIVDGDVDVTDELTDEERWDRIHQAINEITLAFGRRNTPAVRHILLQEGLVRG